MYFSPQEKQHVTTLPTEDYHGDLLKQLDVFLFWGLKEITKVTGWKRMDIFVNCDNKSWHYSRNKSSIQAAALANTHSTILQKSVLSYDNTQRQIHRLRILLFHLLLKNENIVLNAGIELHLHISWMKLPDPLSWVIGNNSCIV